MQSKTASGQRKIERAVAKTVCPGCRTNRRYYGGLCPPCLTKNGIDPETAKKACVERDARGKGDYSSRDRTLARMGFSSYSEYLKSELWAKVREMVFEKLGKRCYVCHRRRKATQVHHLRYTRSNLSGESTRGMRPVCSACHWLVEFDPRGVKLGVRAARKKTARMRRYKGMRKIATQIEKRKRLRAK